MKGKHKSAFPIKGICGTNILNQEISELNQDMEYCLKAITSPNQFFTIRIIGQEGINWSFPMSKRNGWFIETFNATIREQILKMDENSKAETAINFSGKGKAIIEYYENQEDNYFYAKELIFR